MTSLHRRGRQIVGTDDEDETADVVADREPRRQPRRADRDDEPASGFVTRTIGVFDVTSTKLRFPAIEVPLSIGNATFSPDSRGPCGLRRRQ